MIITQTAAIFVDAYRELNARKLFWITLGLSGLVVAAFSLVGIDEEGVSFAVWRMGFIPANTDIVSAEVFYKGLFQNLGISIWLSWVASILALVSTAGMIPDLISSGTIESMLARPIGRVRLFLTKYLAGLLFVALQVLVFTLGCFLVFGVRAGVWEPGLFLAVPVVVVFFSYLYAVCVLLGMITRSTIAALLITGLFWCALIVLNRADEILVAFTELNRNVVEQREQRIENIERFTGDVIRREEHGTIEAANEAGFVVTQEMMDAKATWLPAQRAALEEEKEDLRSLEAWSLGIVIAKAPLPKTSETIALLERWLIDLDDVPTESDVTGEERASDEDDLVALDGDEVEFNRPGEVEADSDVVNRRTAERFRGRSVAWVVGTSLGFEAFILGITAFLFKRRNF